MTGFLRWFGSRDPAVRVLLVLLMMGIIVSFVGIKIYSSFQGEYLSVRHPILQSDGYKGEAKLVDHNRFGELIGKVGIDMRFDREIILLAPHGSIKAEKNIGLPEAYEQQSGGRKIYSYLYPADCTDLNGHRQMNLFGLSRAATLTFVFDDKDRLRTKFFSIAPGNGGVSSWPFLTFLKKDQPLANCVREDMVKLLGEPTDSNKSGDILVWYFKPDPPKSGPIVQAIYVHAKFDREGELGELMVQCD